MNSNIIMQPSKYPQLQILTLFIISVAIKTLLIPAYFSTDFDVHQNWLRITSTKPLKQWYFDEESKWTLDYPPLFAFFEWVLAQTANVIDPAIASAINKLPSTIYFQRFTVILSEIPFLLVLFRIIGAINFKLAVAYFSLPFILLDNIHFQYNIIMQAFFLLAVYLIEQRHFLWGAFTYACLLNFKHIYLYCSLAFLAYILKHYVCHQTTLNQKIMRLCKVGAVTLLPFFISFLPFVVAGGVEQLSQIISRLFPFQRGLIHEYWAPNFWALYYFVDKMLNMLITRFTSSRVSIQEISGDLHHLKILPEVSPLCTTLIILLLTAPLLLKLISSRMHFSRLVFLCGALFFLFGFHVHEKAITPYVGLLLVWLTEEEERRRPSYIASAVFVNTINLLPLLIDSNEKMLRVALPFLWIAICEYRHGMSGYLQSIIFAAGITIVLYHELIHPLAKPARLQFLPLMLNSVFAATFNLCWISVHYYRTIKGEEGEQKSEGYIAVSSEQRK